MFSHKLKLCLLLPLLLLLHFLDPTSATFGNEYVHIKVHVPKEESAEPSSHKVIHHYHHHPRARHRAPAKHTASPVLESVILSELDKPSHIHEHTEYLNHAKDLADHLSDAYAHKKAPPPLPPRKKINTYTVIEEYHRPAAHSYEHEEDSYRVRDTHHHQHHQQQEQQHQQHQQHQHQAQPTKHAAPEEDEDAGYHYEAASTHYQRPKPSSYRAHYQEPAPVEEPPESEAHIDYPPYPSTGRAAKYGHSSFRPSPQLPAEPPAYDDEPEPSHTHHADYQSTHPSADTFNSIDSYSVGHVQSVDSGGYQYAGPYAP